MPNTNRDQRQHQQRLAQRAEKTEHTEKQANEPGDSQRWCGVIQLKSRLRLHSWNGRVEGFGRHGMSKSETNKNEFRTARTDLIPTLRKPHELGLGDP